MHRYGYARSSTLEQDTSIQVEALQRAGCTTIVEEKRSGVSREGRTELENLLKFIRHGDELVVTRIDRLARSVADLQDIVRLLRDKGASLVATEQPINTSTASGNAFLQMLAVFAEFENNLRRERQMEGITKAKKAGVYKGRKPSIDASEVKRLLDAGIRPTDVAKKLGIGRASVYRLCN